MTSSLTVAVEQFAALKTSLSPAVQDRIEQRLASFSVQEQRSPAKQRTASELVFLTRPGAPPRPLPSTLFVLKNYDPHH